MTTLIVVPCGGAKLDHRAPARYLYTGAHFRYTLRRAVWLAEGRPGVDVAILSALHGLVDLDDELDPYDVTLDAAARRSELVARLVVQLLDRDVPDRIVALTPNAYTAALSSALDELGVRDEGVELVTPLAGSRGIGEQRGRLARLSWAEL